MPGALWAVADLALWELRDLDRAAAANLLKEPGCREWLRGLAEEALARERPLSAPFVLVRRLR